MRHLIIAASVLTAAATPAAMHHRAAAFAGFHGAPVASVASVARDSTLCGALHAIMLGGAGHAAPDSATIAAVHSMMAAHHGQQVTLDSTQMAALHNLHAQLLQVHVDSATHEQLKAVLHGSMDSKAQADSAHVALHNAMMACMQHGG
jgi:hypothetical protein